MGSATSPDVAAATDASSLAMPSRACHCETLQGQTDDLKVSQVEPARDGRRSYAGRQRAIRVVADLHGQLRLSNGVPAVLGRFVEPIEERLGPPPPAERHGLAVAK